MSLQNCASPRSGACLGYHPTMLPRPLSLPQPACMLGSIATPMRTMPSQVHRRGSQGSELACRAPSSARNKGAVLTRAAASSGGPSQAAKHFPGCMNIDEFVPKIAKAIADTGFDKDNALPFVNLCRDEVTFIFKNKLEDEFGPAFNINGLGAGLTCGATGLGAGMSHAYRTKTGKPAFIFFSFPHIGIDADGQVGKIWRDRQPDASGACGAMVGALGAIQGKGLAASCGCTGEHEHDDPEFSILKQRIAERMKKEGMSEDAVKKLDLVGITKVGERAISADLEALIQKAGVPQKSDYAVVTGVQIHNWSKHSDPNTLEPNPTELVAISSAYVVNNGKRTNLDINAIRSASGGAPAAVRAPPAAQRAPAYASQGAQEVGQEVSKGAFDYAPLLGVAGLVAYIYNRATLNAPQLLKFVAWYQILVTGIALVFRRAELENLSSVVTPAILAVYSLHLQQVTYMDAAVALFGYYICERLEGPFWAWVATLAAAIAAGYPSQWFVAAFGLSAAMRLVRGGQDGSSVPVALTAPTLAAVAFAFWKNLTAPFTIALMIGQIVASGVKYAESVSSGSGSGQAATA